MFANVIVDITNEKLDKVFQYAVPKGIEDKIYEGALVNVPFGKGNRLINAFVVEITDVPEFDEDKIKAIDSIIDTKVSSESNMIRLASFIRRNYGGTMNQALKTVIPIKEEVTKKAKKLLKLNVDNEVLRGEIEIAKKKNAVARVRLMEALLEDAVIPYELVTGKLNISSPTVKKLEEMGIIKVSEVDWYRNPITVINNDKKVCELNPEQRKVACAIKKDYELGIRNPVLIHGITGSGKTEIYLDVIDYVVSQGKEVIMLIPEISLTYQTVRRFYARFGDKVSIINSKLSKGERYDQMMRAKKGEISIMIGPRSALFTPFSNLGLIVIDEEHEGSYKSEAQPRYHAREVAVELARLNNALVILGSATPSLEAYYKAECGEYKLYTLDKRANESVLPKVLVCDLREELRNGNRGMFSKKLKELISDRLSKNEQIMLFLNRRGYSNFVSCRQCGEVMKCPHCDVSLKFHNNNTLMCHYCGYRISMPKLCPKCSSKYIAAFGVGTQKVEEEVKKIFPAARTLRMDFDTTQKKDDYEKILSAFSNHEADVLVGTQMIVKGHDFPEVTLVGIIAADLSLYANDYRAAERTFELLVQASGRAGRGKIPGEVIVQTYNPEEYSIVSAAVADYKTFYDKEMSYRRMLSYPPVSNMLVVKVASRDMELCERNAELLGRYISERLDADSQLIGPVNAAVYKVSDIFTNLLYIKDSKYDKLTMYKDIIEDYIKDNRAYKNVSVQFDFNPMNI